ncbi:lysyl-tRNA synthetase, class II [Geosmithia morbida]|uniref:Lysyl-tRNA synthetase, class II n=1 Tax=Geosmithia morbida TaxID=1094350 RepID=A0A9P5D6U9_9HYPO|nr:lysyl-tRNA synthetase, class II [Geosmithia morbida]KAF4125135.1 lysyl-tRNA synthetase, class II [Geosmithia morbida]
MLEAVTGIATRTSQGEPTLKAVELPELLSPAMEQIPDELTDPKTKMHNRHVDMLVNKEVTDVLRMRAEITKFMREHLYAKRFLEFQTPILSQNAGGAVARPFVTTATEFRDKHLAMRIAPELWLKRLVVGGVDRVFEIGPSFRNEGIDATHNPEFTMCEFYSAYSNLADLINETEELLGGLAERAAQLIDTELTSLPRLDMDRFKRPFKQVEFVPALEDALGFRLPKLSSEDALPELLVALKLADVSVPGEVPSTLPKLLDRLAAMYLEPQSFEQPVFITHHPSCMSPLSKSFVCPTTFQLVSARAELFVGGRELANMYEEENDPEEQKRKLATHRNLVNKPDGSVAIEVPPQSHPQDEAEIEGIETDVDGETSPLDQSFIKALDYGLPPTGGWGCGVERLVMLFSGAKRISDCLSFGTLKNVVGLSAENEDDRKLKQPANTNGKA